jgi:formate hydrogenlyase subunit 6/NADH:ubiquinone oxidoreductase subunit I
LVLYYCNCIVCLLRTHACPLKSINKLSNQSVVASINVSM